MPSRALTPASLAQPFILPAETLERLRGPPGKDAPPLTAADVEAVMTPALVAKLVSGNKSLTEMIKRCTLAELRHAQHMEVLKATLLTPDNLREHVTTIAAQELTPEFITARITTDGVMGKLTAAGVQQLIGSSYIESVVTRPDIIANIVTKDAVTRALPLDVIDARIAKSVQTQLAVYKQTVEQAKQVADQQAAASMERDSATFINHALSYSGLHEVVSIEGRYHRVKDVVVVYFSITASLPRESYLKRT
jgi:hypothetical protein